MQVAEVDKTQGEGKRSSLTKEQIYNIIRFLDAVQDIVDRLVIEEGYRVIDGELYPPAGVDNN